MNCNGCGVELDPSQGQVNAAVDQILETSLKDAEKKGGVCPLCGHCKDVPYSQRRSVLVGARQKTRFFGRAPSWDRGRRVRPRCLARLYSSTHSLG